ncbi:MAG: DUF5675 family protein [Nitrospiraceae bacterium]
MEMLLVRDYPLEHATTGDLTIDGVHECYICEDVVRDPGVKVDGKTAIPYGRYRIVVTWSDRFQKPMPLLVDVPGFTGVRIHPGNTEFDTEGCLLPGTDRDINAGIVSRSVLAFVVLFDKIKDALESESVYLTIKPKEIP